MKKTLVAIAAVAAVTGAMADATITGIMEASIANTSTGLAMGAGTNGGSEFTIGASEDVGDGMKVFGQTTFVYNPNNTGLVYSSGTTTGSGSTATTASGSTSSYQNWVGISGDFGSVKVGQFWSNTFLTSTVGDPVGRSAFSNYLAGGAILQVANAVNYTSPTFSGVTINYQKSMDKTVDANQYSSYSIGYSNGPLNASFASGTRGVSSSNTLENLFAANYNLGMATVYISSTNSTTTGSSAVSTTGFGVAVPFGAATVSVGTSSSSTVDNYQALLNYDLSKRSRVYLHTANGTTTAHLVTTQIGIRHNF